jgi:spore germination protein KC
LVQVVGIDKIDDSSSITVASKKLTEEGNQQSQSGGSGQSAGGNKALVDFAEGRTLFEAARNIQIRSDRTIFWGHVEYFLIGEDAAKENIAKYIDFISRDNEFHFDSKVYIVKGMTAKDLIQQFNESDTYIADKLDSLGEAVKLVSISEEMKLSDLMRFIDIHWGSARIPCIKLVKYEEAVSRKIIDIKSSGYAIIANLKLASFIDQDISRGLNMISNKIGSSIVAVKDLHGNNVYLEITSGRTEVIPHFAGDTLEEVTLKTKIKSNLGEIQSQQRSFYEENFKHLEAQLNETLKNEMQLVLDTVLKAESDCLGICDAIRIKRPVKWHRIESRWMEIVARIRYRIEVESTIERSYDLNEPSGYRGPE